MSLTEERAGWLLYATLPLLKPQQLQLQMWPLSRRPGLALQSPHVPPLGLSLLLCFCS